MLIQQVALTTESEALGIGLDELMRVGAALQKQVTRDFAPIWGIRATVDAFARLEDVPIGYWPIILVKNLKGAEGVHQDNSGQPFALVKSGSSWPLTASHECLEMLADPFGNRLIAGPSPKKGQGRVEFLVEVCDPSESEKFGYTVNGVLVSDFYTPHYFDPKPAVSVRYSFTGAITAPRQVLKNGYLSWHDPVSDRWFQETFFGVKPTFRDLGVLRQDGSSFRSIVDSMTHPPEDLANLEAAAPLMAAASKASADSEESTTSKARSWRTQISALREKAQKPE
jgi:hypothetical protein